MYRFSYELIKKRRVAKKLSFRSMSALTTQIDPAGKGLSVMTCQRIETGVDPSVRSLIIACVALGISPKSVFIKEEMK